MSVLEISTWSLGQIQLDNPISVSLAVWFRYSEARWFCWLWRFGMFGNVLTVALNVLTMVQMALRSQFQVAQLNIFDMKKSKAIPNRLGVVGMRVLNLVDWLIQEPIGSKWNQMDRFFVENFNAITTGIRQSASDFLSSECPLRIANCCLIARLIGVGSWSADLRLSICLRGRENWEIQIEYLESKF